ncbi:hypothetical protein, partial [Pseudomonas sp. FW306-2-2C-D06B]|uniref:hypothetical protein n=1 Tax=Pseudomonas sp. FW306-2-2C-D06B TaxID=2070645 RepID=UPI001C48E4A6
RPLGERPCVAIGLRSSPGNLSGEAEIMGLLRSPIATQGRSHKVRAARYSELARLLLMYLHR